MGSGLEAPSLSACSTMLALVLAGQHQRDGAGRDERCLGQRDAVDGHVGRHRIRAQAHGAADLGAIERAVIIGAGQDRGDRAIGADAEPGEIERPFEIGKAFIGGAAGGLRIGFAGRQRHDTRLFGQEQTRQHPDIAARIGRRHQAIVGGDDGDIGPFDLALAEQLQRFLGRFAAGQRDDGAAARFQRLFDDETGVAGNGFGEFGGVVIVPPFGVDHGFEISCAAAFGTAGRQRPNAIRPARYSSGPAARHRHRLSHR